MGRYDDIIHLPRPVCRRAKPLTGAERAAQFSPFAALSGYEAAIREAARLTEPAVELAEDGAAALDEKLRLLVENLPRRPEVTVTWFEPDEKKEGGALRVFTGRLRRVDETAGLLLFEGGRRLPLAAVRGLESEISPTFCERVEKSPLFRGAASARPVRHGTGEGRRLLKKPKKRVQKKVSSPLFGPAFFRAVSGAAILPRSPCHCSIAKTT